MEMIAVQISRYGGSEVVEVNDIPKPQLSEESILIEVHAASVNPIDWKIRQGYMQQWLPLKFPAILGGDFSGVVMEVGKSIQGFRKGDEVFGTASILSGGSGAFAEFVSTNAKLIAKKPKKASHVETAALPLAGVSAWQALVDHIRISKGKKILIHGGAGGIGSFAVQIAKYLGAYVTTTVSANDKQYVKELGADEIIDYKTQRFEDLARDYDAVFDTVGGETYKNSFKVLKKGGIIVSMLEQADAELMKKYGVISIAQGTQVNKDRLSKLAELVDRGIMKIHVDKTFPLEQAGKALACLQEGHPKGKVVLKIKKK